MTSAEVYKSAMEWLAVGAMPLRNGGMAIESLEEAQEFIAYVLEHADELAADEGEDSLDPAGYWVLAVRKRSGAKPDRGEP